MSCGDAGLPDRAGSARSFPFSFNILFSSIGGFPDKILQLSEQGGVLRDSLQFTLPPGIARLTMEAFLDSLPFANPVISIDSQIWPVQ